MPRTFRSTGRFAVAGFLAVSLIAGHALSPAASAPSPAAAADTRGLERGHSHNDYAKPRPVYDAMAADFKSVEADVCLSSGKLLLDHDCKDMNPNLTLESLFLTPLRQIVGMNGGSVYQGDPDYFTLLVDLKSANAEATYTALHAQLARNQKLLPAMFTTFGPNAFKKGAITVIVSGNRPARRSLLAQSIRYAAYDGRIISDLGAASAQTFMPLISHDWSERFTWQGKSWTGWTGAGPMPPDQRELLRGVIQAAHAKGKRVRFWATPEESPQRENVWRELVAAKVDYVNTDHLTELHDFLLGGHDPQPSVPWISWGDPAPPGGGAELERISAGAQHSCALRQTGQLVCWGENLDGRLGDGTTMNRSSPVAVKNISTATAISAGWTHSCAVHQGGAAACWGEGALGDGTIIGPQPTPVAVPNLSDATSISAGSYHSCALRRNGQATCWGDNSAGQLGDGTADYAWLPVAVKVNVGLGHACAVRRSGQAACWGHNYSGQVGDGSQIDRWAPVRVVGLP